MEDDKDTGEMPDSKDKVDTSSSSSDTAAELDRTREALKQANKESAERRKKLEAYEKAEADKVNADLTETQRLSKELEQVRADADKAKSANRRYELERGIARAAKAQLIEFASDDALSDAIALGVFGEIADDLSNAEQVLKNVRKTKSYLFKQVDEQQQRKSDINGGARGRGNTQSDAVEAEKQRLRQTGKY